MQPDPVEWVHRASITLQDLPDMVCFPVNPFLHLHADLAEVWSMRWSADTLKQFEVTFEHHHVQVMDADIVKRCFDMPKDEVVEVTASYKSYQ